MQDIDSFFKHIEDARHLFETVQTRIESLGPVQIKISQTQIVFRRKKNFAWIWIPEKHLHRKAAPLVLSISFPKPNPSPRWKQVVEPAPGRFMHHLELYRVADVDEDVDGWLRDAWDLAA